MQCNCILIRVLLNFFQKIAGVDRVHGFTKYQLYCSITFITFSTPFDAVLFSIADISSAFFEYSSSSAFMRLSLFMRKEELKEQAF